MGSVSAMDIAQMVTLVAGILAIIWYLQRSIGGLRTELKGDNAELKAELKGDLGSLQAAVIDIGQRLARIEGFLGIGMPAETARGAAGARYADPD